MSVSALVGAVQNYRSVAAFIEGQGLIDALSVISETAISAAEFALANSKEAFDRKGEVGRAVGHLQTAHVALRKIWEPRSNKKKASYTEWNKDIYVCCLMATCYLYLDEIPLAKRSATLAKEAYQARYIYETIYRHKKDGMIYLIEMGTDLATGRFFEDDNRLISDHELEEFSKTIQSY